MSSYRSTSSFVKFSHCFGVHEQGNTDTEYFFRVLLRVTTSTTWVGGSILIFRRCAFKHGLLIRLGGPAATSPQKSKSDHDLLGSWHISLIKMTLTSAKYFFYSELNFVFYIQSGLKD
ncbi:hypothetical protein CEXT_638201 [Caerostris extrusa]|uniref:Uncharacterized protein n=1 Tax=Caerostris extrusa TaxID=172846 RepID=A0AAV4UTL0_CAEEX|nr:hypothetical protein CEXT_638201 [Caerostris extrusa]